MSQGKRRGISLSATAAFGALVAVVMAASAGRAGAGEFGARISVAEKFDHDLHNARIFGPQKLQCAKCHNFSVDPATRKAVPSPSLRERSLRLPLRQICHECHQGADARYEAAPKTCYTCHSSPTSLGSIKPESHTNIVWRSKHAAEARIAGDTCLNCHTTSQCVKCHTQRNDVEVSNHTRNFRFFHSVQARLQPQRCDACHTKSFCVNCHVGRK